MHVPVGNIKPVFLFFFKIRMLNVILVTFLAAKLMSFLVLRAQNPLCRLLQLYLNKNDDKGSKEYHPYFIISDLSWWLVL